MTTLRVQLCAFTAFLPPADIPWTPDERLGELNDLSPDGGFGIVYGGEQLAEFAGRACYLSWKKPNPETATNAGYIRHILDVGHLSVLEHGSCSFWITGVSRSLTHELVRHRHFSYSQLSQRYVPGMGRVVEPEVIAEDPELHAVFLDAAAAAEDAYMTLKLGLEEKFAHLPDSTGKKKAARQAARAVLPNATETKIVVTGNYRALRHFFHMRATEHADVEIRALAIEMLRQVKARVPAVFDDYVIKTLADGTEVATTDIPGEV